MSDSVYTRSSSRASEDRIVRRVRALEKRVDRGLRTPQLTRSAIDDGAIPVTSGGTTTAIIGQQYDGTTAVVVVNGPTPPTPQPPQAVSVVGGVRVTVTGLWEDPQPGFSSPVVAPQDFHRWDVEVSTDPAFPEFASPMASNNGSVLSPSGGQIKVAWPAGGTTLYVRVRARTQAGKRSAPSGYVQVTSGAVGLGDLGFNLADYAAGNTILYGTAQPATPDRIGTLWIKEVAAGPPPKYETRRWTGSQWALLQDQQASTAIVQADAAAQAAAVKAQLFTQPAPPAYSGAAGTAYWFDSDDGMRPYRWNGSAWADHRLSTGAFQPNSVVASTILATGTISAPLLETVMVLTTAVLAGDPDAEHSRLDANGLRAFANDEGLPVEVGYFGRGFGVRNPDTGVIVGGINDAGDISGNHLDALDPDPTFGGVALSDIIAPLSKGSVVYGLWPAGTVATATNTEVAFMELAFTAYPGRQYAICMEAIEPINSAADPGGWLFRLRATSATAPATPATPTTASGLIREFNYGKGTDAGWNTAVPHHILYNGPPAGTTDARNVRLLFCYAAGTGTQVSTGASMYNGRNVYMWVQDLGLNPGETGDPIAGTSGGTTTKTTYTYQQTANWVRTWNQSNGVIEDNEMHQGYGDSFNGIRRSAAGWTNLPNLTGAAIQSLQIYMESYHWWNMSGGTMHMGYHNASGEPAGYPAATGFIDVAFSARSQGKWISVPAAWLSAIATNGLKGIALIAPSTAAAYYGKFRGPASQRPQLKVVYTK